MHYQCVILAKKNPVDLFREVGICCLRNFLLLFVVESVCSSFFSPLSLQLL